jgi:hypothetical protein
MINSKVSVPLTKTQLRQLRSCVLHRIATDSPDDIQYPKLVRLLDEFIQKSNNYLEEQRTRMEMR